MYKLPIVTFNCWHADPITHGPALLFIISVIVGSNQYYRPLQVYQFQPANNNHYLTKKIMSMKIINLTRLLEPTRLRLLLMSGSAWPVSVQTIGNRKNTTSTDGNKLLSCIDSVKRGKQTTLPAPMVSNPINKKLAVKS